MSNRLNLREFQQNLIDRLQTVDVAAERVSTLGVEIAGANWLVDMGDIKEVLPLPKLSMVPLTKPWFHGMANIRGNLYGVVDVAAYWHIGSVNGNAGNRVLVVADRFKFNAALLVDSVHGLRDARTWEQGVGFDKQPEYRDEHGGTWRKLDVQGLLEQVDFLQIGV